jgi:hypothetical protein
MRYDRKNRRYYAAQIAFLDNPSDTLVLSPGQEVTKVPYFEPGTGLSAWPDRQYDTMTVTNTGHHYVFYENESSGRATLVSQKDDLLELECRVVALHHDGTTAAVSDLQVQSILVVILIDRNINGTIDDGELSIVKIGFQ